MTYYDKSLIEVWSWKEKVNESFRHLTLSEQLTKLTESAEKRRGAKDRRELPTAVEKRLAY